MTKQMPNSRSLFSALPALLTAPLLALGLSWSTPAVSSITPQAIASVHGLRMVDMPTVPSLPDMVVSAGLDTIGTPYVWGGNDPDNGFDCSGLTKFVFREIVGIDLPRTAREQRHEGTGVKRHELKPGDLVFFNTTRRRAVSHVGIYIGNNQFVHAPTRGSTVRVDSMKNSYWAKRYITARRVIDTPTDVITPSTQLVAQADTAQ